MLKGEMLKKASSLTQSMKTVLVTEKNDVPIMTGKENRSNTE